MSYAVSRSNAASLDREAIQVGTAARRDPLLAQASLDAAQILRQAVKVPRSERDIFVQGRLSRYGQNAVTSYKHQLAVLTRKKGRNQAIFDAMRLAIADYYARQGIAAIRAALDAHGSPALGALSDDPARAAGCAITGGITAIGGSILGVYTGGAGSAATAVGGSLVGAALNCSEDQQRAAQDIAASQARQAQAEAERARVEAEHQQAAAAEQTKKVVTVAIIGGGTLLLLGTVYMIVK